MDRYLKIPRFRMSLPFECRAAVQKVLETGHLAEGHNIGAFEESVAHRLGYESVVTTANGFSALVLAIEVEVGRGDKEILIPASSTCLAVANAVKASGNRPVLYDTDLKTLTMDMADLKKKISSNTSAVILVPCFGIPVDVQTVEEEIDPPVIVDAAQYIFSAVSGKFWSGSLATFSFYPTKGLVSIDGGAVACEDRALAERIKDLRYYGHQKSLDGQTRYNYRLNNVNAAVALWYLSNFHEISSRRYAIQQRYNEAVRPYTDLFKWHPDDRLPPLQKYVLVFIEPDQAKRFIGGMQKKGIEVSYELLLLEDAPLKYPNASMASNCLVSVPMYEALEDNEIEYVCKSMQMILESMINEGG